MYSECNCLLDPIDYLSMQCTKDIVCHSQLKWKIERRWCRLDSAFEWKIRQKIGKHFAPFHLDKITSSHISRFWVPDGIRSFIQEEKKYIEKFILSSSLSVLSSAHTHTHFVRQNGIRRHADGGIFISHIVQCSFHNCFLFPRSVSCATWKKENERKERRKKNCEFSRIRGRWTLLAFAHCLWDSHFVHTHTWRRGGRHIPTIRLLFFHVLVWIEENGVICRSPTRLLLMFCLLNLALINVRFNVKLTGVMCHNHREMWKWQIYSSESNCERYVRRQGHQIHWSVAISLARAHTQSHKCSAKNMPRTYSRFRTFFFIFGTFINFINE